MLSALQINAHSRHDALASEELAIDHQHQQLRWYWPLQQLLQLLGRGSLPMPAHTRTFDPIALETTLDGPFIVTRRALPYQLPLHRLLHFAILLKGGIAFQAYFLVLTA